MSAAMALNSGPASRISRQPGRPSAVYNSRDHADGSNSSAHPQAGPSRMPASQPDSRRLQHDDPVRTAQEEATRVWKADMRRLLERAEERFADVCWTTTSAEPLDQQNHFDSDLGHSTSAYSSSVGRNSSDTAHARNTLIPPQSPSEASSSIPNSTATSAGTLIWAHKAILYARAPNTFQTRFLNLRSPAAQLEHIGSTASLVSLPLQSSESQLSLASDFSSSTQTGAAAPPNPSAFSSNANTLSSRTGIPAKPRKPIRGAAPPSSFSMTRPSLRKPISRASISRPLHKGSIDDAGSYTSGFATSDSEGEGGPASSLRASRLINATPPATAQYANLTSPSKLSHTSSSIGHGSSAPVRKSSFASVTSAADSHLTETRSVVSDASTLRAPISLGEVSPAFFEATLQYLYTSEEAMVDAFEFLFEDRLASDSEVTPDEKLDKLRSDLTFMWRSKLYSDVKLVLGDDDDDDQSDNGDGGGRQRRVGSTKMMDIPDANMSVLSLAQTVDTDRIDESDAEDDELTSFSTHRMILASRSQYFASLLLSPYADSRAPVLHLPSPPFTPASLHFTLGFLYTGTLFFSNRTFDLSTAFSLWRAGAYLQIETLQALVATLIEREFCHGFVCSPPCRKCVRRVPRTLAFATSPDVSEQTLQESAIAAVSGAHFGMYWAKDVGNLDPMLQDRIVDSISDRLNQDPTLVVSVLRQLSIVGQRIDTERSSRWVESLRLMAETVENRVMPILHTNLDKIVQSAAWSDLLDGIGSLGDVLEKCLVMLIDGLTESRAGQVYQTLVGQVLLREQGFEVAQSRQAVETARGSILRYLQKRWINVRALAGFNKLEKWCLKELADELDVTTTDLVLPQEVPRPSKAVGPPSRLMAARRTSSLASGSVGATSSGTGPTSSLSPAAASSSRLKSPSVASTASLSGNAASSTTTKKQVRDDGEREAGPIHMRAAVLNRNAARTSVANGHRSLSATSASESSASSSTARPSGSSVNGASPRTTPKSKAVSSVTPNSTKTVTATRSAKPSSASPSVARSAAASGAALGKQPRLRTTSGSSVASLASARSTNAKASHSAAAATATSPDGAPTPTRSTTRRAATPDANRTPAKHIRNVRSTTTLPSRSTTSTSTSTSHDNTKQASLSVDSAAAATADKSTKQPPVLGHKSSFLRATPGPGGTFSLSSTDSGRDLRARTISTGSTTKRDAGTAANGKASSVGSRSTTPTKTTPRSDRKRSTSPSSVRGIATSSSGDASRTTATGARVEAMPVDALVNVERARQLPRSDSTKTMVYRPVDASAVDAEAVAEEGGVSLHVGIPCIVSLPLGGGGVEGKTGAPVQRKPVGGPVRPMGVKKTANASSATGRASASAAAAAPGRKVRAQVRYLGPVSGHTGMWVGITVSLSPSHINSLFATSRVACPVRLTDGYYNGVRYFCPDCTQAVEAEWRIERRMTVYEQVGAATTQVPERAKTQAAATAKAGTREDEKRAEAETASKDALTVVELFVRPADVVWVVQ
ncbi:hypothetical protein EX895_005893 [Sporisorium graminicola]|uniref:BTB domain-containing protein n=1 Tax=Sporisorium graminicola TaxID=280036 RepID=A0A4U7KLH7_9BASI|nr:hypothetical protein EX895_005893 [Sporisorium graminicola]TKY84813.1 hypothetical protein EX895_005893 [Sporisorium graminicola]